MKLWRELTMFGIIGSVGLIIDTAVLYALKPLLGLFVSRGFSFLAAAITTWFLNKTFTFKRRKSALAVYREFIAYIVLMLVGGTANFATYTWLVFSYENVQNNPFIGVAAGSLAGMLLNYSTSKFFLFTRNQN